jgi:fructose-bisphosphate aldolase class II
METAAKLNSPVIIQFSNGGAAFNAGKGLSNDGQKAAILGAIAGANTSTLLLKLTEQL